MSRIRTIALVGLVLVLAAAVLAQGGRKITGIVVSEGREQPVRGALVHYMDDATGAEQTARTDGKGRFEMPYGTGGVVTVNAQDYGTLRRSWPPRLSTELRFELTPPATMSGSLVDAVSRRGVDGRVTLRVNHPINHITSTVNARGSFAFDDLLVGPATVVAYADHFAPYFGATTIEADQSHNMQIALLLEARVSGHVLNQDDSPVFGAVVRVGYDSSMPGADTLAGLARGNTMTVPDGSFAIGGLLPDEPIALQAEFGGRMSDVVTVANITPGFEQPRIVLRMQ